MIQILLHFFFSSPVRDDLHFTAFNSDPSGRTELKAVHRVTCFMFLILWSGALCAIPSIDFDSSMQSERFTPGFEYPKMHQILNSFRSLYEKHNPASILPSSHKHIPTILHHIWLGSPFPERYEKWYQSWRKLHPQWTFVFWTDTEKNYDKGDIVVHSFYELNRVLTKKRTQYIVVDVRHLEFGNRCYFDQALNYGEKSDILRWDIVYRYGGVYVDTDFESIKPLDELHYLYDFYTGLQPLDTHFPQLGAGLFGAVPKHPIVKQCVDTIKENRNKQYIIIRTGPIHFTQSFLLKAYDGDFKNIAFPATYFYPCSFEQQGKPRTSWLREESFAVHHWEGSWLKGEDNA